MSVQLTRRTPLVFVAIVIGGCLGWVMAASIWLCRAPATHIPSALSPGLAEYLAGLLCVCAVVMPVCWHWTARRRTWLLACLIGGYALGLLAAPLKDELKDHSFEHELAQIRTLAFFEFHPSWGLAGAVIGGMVLVLGLADRPTPGITMKSSPHI